MLDLWQDCPFGRRITFQLVSHDHPGRFSLAAEQAPKETLGRIRIPPFLDEDIKHDSVLIDSPPEIVQLAPDPDKHLIEVPFIPGLWPTPLEGRGELPRKADGCPSPECSHS